MTVRSPHISILLFIYLICERVNFECKITHPTNFSQSPFLGNFKRRKYLISISELCATTRRNENADDELPFNRRARMDESASTRPPTDRHDTTARPSFQPRRRKRLNRQCRSLPPTSYLETNVAIPAIGTKELSLIPPRRNALLSRIQNQRGVGEELLQAIHVIPNRPCSKTWPI